MAGSNPLDTLKNKWSEEVTKPSDQNPLDSFLPSVDKPESSNQIDFWDVIDFFNKPENSYLEWFIPALEELQKSLEENITAEIREELNKLIKGGSASKILFYIEKLQEIQKEYEQGSSEITEATKEEESTFSRIVKWAKDTVSSATDSLKPRVITDEEFAEITWIDINGSQTVWELAESIKKFKWKISRWEIGKNLSENERQAIIDQLSKILEWKKIAEEIWYKQIETYFDGLAQNIKKRWGKFIVTLDKWKTKSFDSQKEAVDFIMELKSSAEFHFQSWLRTLLEYTFIWAWNLFLKAEWLVWSIPTTLKEWWSDWLTLDILSLDNLLAVWLYIWSAAITFAIISAHWAIPIWVASSFWRRVVTDNLQKYNSSLQYTDYARGQWGQALDMSSPEGRDFMEMKQRQQIMDLLWADLETNYAQWSKKYNEYRKIIEKIDSYKLNRTPTFYYLAYKYWKLSWKASRFGFSIASIALRGARFYYPDFERDDTGKRTSKLPIWRLDYISFEDSKSLASKTLSELLDIESIREGIEIFYKSKTVERVSKDKEPPKIEVEWDDTKTDKYNYVIDEINARNIPESEKKKLLKDFNDYVNRLIDFPKSPNVIARDLHILLNTNHGQKADFIRQLRTKINKVQEDNSRIKNGLWKAGKWKLGRLNSFLSLVERGEWVGSKKEFDTEIKKIESKSDYKVSPNYDSKLWSTNFGQKLQDIFDRWEKAAKTHKTVLGEFYDNTKVWSWEAMPWKDFDTAQSYETKLMKWIQDYIDFGIHNDALENFAKTEVKEMFDKIISWKIMIEDEDRLFAEIQNIFKWYLPTYKLVARLDNIIEANKKHGNVDDIKKLYQEAKKWKLNVSPQELLELEKDPWAFDYTVDRSRWIPVLEKSKMERLVRDTQWWRNFDYNKTFWLADDASVSQYLDKLKEKFSWELELIQVLDVVNDTSTKSWITVELWEFSKALSKNKYSKWQADHILREIFWGKAFSSITLPMVWDAADFYDGKSDLSDKLQEEWDKLSEDEKVEKAKKIKQNSNIDESKITIIDIQKTLKNLDWASKAETLKNQNIAEIERLTNEVSRAKWERTLRTAYDNFNRIISDTSRNINSWEEPFKTLIAEFNDAYETSETRLGVIVKPTEEVKSVTPEEVKPAIPEETEPKEVKPSVLLATASRPREIVKPWVITNPEIVELIERFAPHIKWESRKKLKTLRDSEEIKTMTRTDFVDALKELSGLTEIPKPFKVETKEERLKRIDMMKTKWNQVLERLAIEIELNWESTIWEDVHWIKRKLWAEIRKWVLDTDRKVLNFIKEIAKSDYWFKWNIRTLAQLNTALQSQANVDDAMRTIMNEKLRKSPTSFRDYITTAIREWRLLRNL